MARGGRRVGVAGRSYTNRSDLRNGPRKPSTPQVAPASTNAQYGAQAQQLRSLQALPLATSQPAPATAGAAAGGTGAAPPQSIADMLAGVDMGPPPGALDRPTERPNEPVTAGVNVGPGPGAPAVAFNPDAEALRAWLPALELLASQPGTTQALRNLTRRIRASEPIDQ